jgi:lipoprotein-releasing system permease protein
MSGLPYELGLALRYLRPKRTYVSIITLISILGVVLGVAVLIIVISVMSGFDRQLKEKILGFNSHMKVYSANGSTLRDYAKIAGKIATIKEVKGVAPLIMGPVLIQTQPLAGEPLTWAPWVRGIDPELESKVSILPSSIKRGKFDVSNKGVLVGVELAVQLGLDIGDPIAVYTPRSFAKLQKTMKDLRENPKRNEEEYDLADEYVVRGIFDVGHYEYNVSTIACSLEDAQDMYDMNDSVNALLVMLHDPYQAEKVRGELKAVLGGNFRIRTWAEESSGILNALIVEKNLMFYILFFIVIVAAFGITSALITFVVQKTREIGMLKALGATSRQIMVIFLSQSLFVGVVGVILGFGLGMLAISYRNEFLHLMNRLTGFNLFPPEIYIFTELPALIVPRDIAIICGGSLLICVLAGLLPAWNAGRLKPVEALRHE